MEEAFLTGFIMGLIAAGLVAMGALKSWERACDAWKQLYLASIKEDKEAE